MRKVSLTFLSVLLVLAIGAGFLGQTRVGGVVRSTALSVWQMPASWTTKALGPIRSWVKEMVRWKGLAGENERLRDENLRLTAVLAEFQARDSQTEFLRYAFALTEKSSRPPILASIFNVTMSPIGYTALINRGVQDGVQGGQFVVSAHGVLIGVVEEVMGRSAQVRLVNDPLFSVTAKIFGSETAGIVRGAGGNELVFEMIVRGDAVIEGDTVISSGDDVFPAGLVIGTVSRVQENDADVFKRVSIRPEANNMRLGKVLIISK